MQHMHHDHFRFVLGSRTHGHVQCSHERVPTTTEKQQDSGNRRAL